MEFKRMSKEMTEKEILLILRIVYPYAMLKRYTREAGYLMVYYSLPGDNKDGNRRIDFLPDDIYIVGEGPDEPSDGIPIKNDDILHSYCQYTVAKGYSEL